MRACSVEVEIISMNNCALPILACCSLVSCDRIESHKTQRAAPMLPDVVWVRLRGTKVEVPNQDVEEWEIRKAAFIYQTAHMGVSRCFVAAHSVYNAEVTYSGSSRIPDPPAPPVVTDLFIPDNVLNHLNGHGGRVARVSECEVTDQGVTDRASGESGLVVFHLYNILWLSSSEAEIAGAPWAGTTGSADITYHLQKVNGVWQVNGHTVNAVS